MGGWWCCLLFSQSTDVARRRQPCLQPPRCATPTTWCRYACCGAVGRVEWAWCGLQVTPVSSTHICKHPHLLHFPSYIHTTALPTPTLPRRVAPGAAPLPRPERRPARRAQALACRGGAAGGTPAGGGAGEGALRRAVPGARAARGGGGAAAGAAHTHPGRSAGVRCRSGVCRPC